MGNSGGLRIAAATLSLACGFFAASPAQAAPAQLPEWAQSYRPGLPESQKARRQFYVDGEAGDDSRNGNAPETAWKTLERVNREPFRAGDHLLFKKGCRFMGAIVLDAVTGSPGAFVRVGAYGTDDRPSPVIDGKGNAAAVRLIDSAYVQIEELEIVNDHGEPKPVADAVVPKTKEKDEKGRRTECAGVELTVRDHGVLQHVYLKRLYVHDIFPAEDSPSEGRINRTHYGYGIRIATSENRKGTVKNVVVEECRIENTGHFGMVTSSAGENPIQNVMVLNNRFDRTGGSGFLASRILNGLVLGNVINRSGSFDDARKHGRGSGSWTFAAENVLYENNTFMNAKGKGDSAGVHIDFSCRDVVVQRNLSCNNEGGFMEVLGNNYNCAYRYNISVNDGARIKGVDGAAQEGKTLFVSGHCMQAPFGPFNSYFYNNTIYVAEGINPKFAITHSAEGLLIANNIFHLLADVKQVEGDQPTAKMEKKKNKGQKAKNVVFRNNVYTRESTLPSDLVIDDEGKIIADPLYANPGGLDPKDYIPGNRQVIKDAGIIIQKLPGDQRGLMGGVRVERDFFGNPIVGRPDIGAIEIN